MNEQLIPDGIRDSVALLRAVHDCDREAIKAIVEAQKGVVPGHGDADGLLHGLITTAQVLLRALAAFTELPEDKILDFLQSAGIEAANMMGGGLL